MTTFKKDTSKVRSFSAGPITHNGFYQVTIQKAYIRKGTQPGAQSEAIQIDGVTEAGQYCSISLWYQARNGMSTDKNGKDLPALQSINDLQVLLDIDELKAIPGKVMLYDYELKQDVETKKMVFKELIGATIGALFEMRYDDYKSEKQGQDVYSPEFLQFADAETMASAAEFLSGDEPVAIQRYLDRINSAEDKHIIKQATNKPNAPVNDPIPAKYDEFDDDIPF